MKLTKLRSYWGDYAILSQVEAIFGDLPMAEKYLTAKALDEKIFGEGYET